MDFLRRVFKGDKIIWVVYMCLCIISIMEVFSAASTLTYKTGDHWGPITQHIGFLASGTFILWVTSRLPYQFFRVAPILLIPISLALLTYLTIRGVAVNGAARWLEFFGIAFQPSEFAKMGVVIGTALILSVMQEEQVANRKAMRYILYLSLPVCFLIFRENGSTALLLLAVVVIMMFIGRVPLKQLFKPIGITLALVIVFLSAPANMLTSISGRLPTMQSRILNHSENKKYITPEDYDIDKNAQVAHANIAIASSHIIGKMPGNSVERDFLSQAFSDFIYAIIIEELGLIGGVFVVFLYMVLLIRVLRIARKCNSDFPKLLIIGIALIIVSQAMLNMAVAVGICPVTGQPLPFISKGGTSTLINCVYIGIILSVSRCIKEQEEKRAAQEALVAEAANGESEEAEEKENMEERGE